MSKLDRNKSIRRTLQIQGWSHGLWIAIILFMAIIHSLAAGHYVDFVPINGTFQNFNPVRRLLSGQIPYRDFADYLGLGHLYSGALATWLFGGNYAASLKAFTFLTTISFALILLVMGTGVLGNLRRAEIFTASALFLVILQPLFYTQALSGTEEIQKALESTLTPGNSARLIRGMAPAIYCMLVYVCYKLFHKSQESALRQAVLKPIVAGAATGFIFLWSNDYGVSVWLCSIIMFLWVQICKREGVLAIIRNCLLMMVSSVVFLVIFAEIFTLGHFREWAVSTFGTGSFQRWYYIGAKTFFIFQIDLSFLTMGQALICVCYMIFLFQHRASEYACKRYGIPALFNMAAFCATNEYRVLSGGDSKETAYTILFVTVLCEAVRVLLAIIATQKTSSQIRKFMKIGVLIASATLIFSTLKDEVVFFRWARKGGTYTEKLGGNLKSPAENLSKTADFLDGEKIFSTYASAIEVVTDQFQPTGTDYIIHVLGDKAREEYLDTFKKGDFAYAATMKENYTGWEIWVQRANWFFYRELLTNYEPTYSNSYELFWKKTDTPNIVTENVETSMVVNKDGTITIQVRADEGVNGLADVFVSYEEEDTIKTPLVLQKMVKVEQKDSPYQDTLHNFNYLRPKSEEYMPIPVVDGYGEVTLTSEPKGYTQLRVDDIHCEKIFTALMDYSWISGASDQKAGVRLRVEADAWNAIKYRDAKAIRFKNSGKEFEILENHSTEEQPHLIVKSNLSANEIKEMLSSGNECEILR